MHREETVFSSSGASLRLTGVLKHAAPWDALDLAWILDFCVTFKQRKGRKRKRGGETWENCGDKEREGAKQEEECRVMGNINKASKKNSKRKKVRKCLIPFRLEK